MTFSYAVAMSPNRMATAAPFPLTHGGTPRLAIKSCSPFAGSGFLRLRAASGKFKIASMTSDDHHFRREDRALLWRRIARHIEGHPDDLAIALENLERWQALGRVHPGPIHDWRQRIHAAQASSEGMRALVRFMAEPNHDSEPIKSCSPFVGLPMAVR